MNPVEFIRAKRDGKKLAREDIAQFVRGAVSGDIPEYQVTAWLMATYFQGLDFEETVALTAAMVSSGKTIAFSDGRPKVDKHSTGGVGDKVSLILAPLVAACGVDVPMVAGRGLGHTGGTLDKLESIPGFNVHLKTEEFLSVVKKHGAAIMGQTREFVPADKLFYSLRDVTGTIECIPLITASILSKKKAEGISALVLDIKVGSGAFMKNQKDAERLAKTLVAVSGRLGLPARALLTDMSQPLGNAAGNAIEVLECIDVLEGRGPADLKKLCIELAAHMLVLGKRTTSLAAARVLAKKALQNRSALGVFRDMCAAQGAKTDIVQSREGLRVSPAFFTIDAKKTGFVTSMDTEKLGLLLVQLGAGRAKASDDVDPSVGAVFHHKIGSFVKQGETLATIHYNPGNPGNPDNPANPPRLGTASSSTEFPIEFFKEEFRKALVITSRHASPPKLIKKVIANGV